MSGSMVANPKCMPTRSVSGSRDASSGPAQATKQHESSARARRTAQPSSVRREDRTTNGGHLLHLVALHDLDLLLHGVLLGSRLAPFGLLASRREHAERHTTAVVHGQRWARSLERGREGRQRLDRIVGSHQRVLALEELVTVLVEELDLAVHALGAAHADPLGGDAAARAMGAVRARAALLLRVRVGEARPSRRQTALDVADRPLALAEEPG